ncbi:fumarate lyase (plasmid) [Xanthobacter versatilis]|uniref:Fumarate lyase n=1 Tax=Xanthobacter autotrophicus (strain ATCC BAA-1158 / Py2) TaxID=78245 RepID=A7IQG9_XANP2|nr:fumarate lyase [Xanthobacter autotrophicus Py2]
MTGWSFGSQIYGSAWSTLALRALFDDLPRTRRWLDILATLAEVQGEFAVIPAENAAAVAKACRAVVLDESFFADVRAGYEATGHSTAGLIQAVRRRSPEAGEWFHFGATVQDVTVSWLMLALDEAREHLLVDLDRAIVAATRLCLEHRDTVKPGRTHGRQGLPITFGFKVAGWLAEMRRHRQRFSEVAARMGVGQLCGGVGSLSALGSRGLEVHQAFCERRGLRPPATSWTISRDVIVEWGHLLVLVAGTADRIGHEIYCLQRDEIDEVREGASREQIGSITMPHKRNPELSEHLGPLSRVVCANAAALAESLPHAHERDGRAWKVEWHAVLELSMAAGKTMQLLERLDVDGERMRSNLEASGGQTGSEAVMLALAAQLGKQTAHGLVHRIAGEAANCGRPFCTVLVEDSAVAAVLSAAEIEHPLDDAVQTAQCGALVDGVLGQDN